MATYSYRCAEHGGFDARLRFATAPGSTPCPVCGVAAGRTWSGVPLLGSRPGRTAVVDHCERSRTEPDVVTEIPARPRAGRGRQPLPSGAHRLPRP